MPQIEEINSIWCQEGIAVSFFELEEEPEALEVLKYAFQVSEVGKKKFNLVCLLTQHSKTALLWSNTLFRKSPFLCEEKVVPLFENCLLHTYAGTFQKV